MHSVLGRRRRRISAAHARDVGQPVRFCAFEAPSAEDRARASRATPRPTLRSVTSICRDAMACGSRPAYASAFRPRPSSWPTSVDDADDRGLHAQQRRRRLPAEAVRQQPPPRGARARSRLAPCERGRRGSAPRASGANAHAGARRSRRRSPARSRPPTQAVGQPYRDAAAAREGWTRPRHARRRGSPIALADELGDWRRRDRGAGIRRDAP